MFFDFSLKKIAKLSAAVALILGATAIFVLENPGFTVGYATETAGAHGKMTASAVSYLIGSKIPQALAGGLEAPPAATTTAKSVPVLVYHGETDAESNLSLSAFIDQMYALKRDGWRTVSVEDFYAFLKGEKQLPDKSFVLTFDDGRKDTYYDFDPVLKDLGFIASMYIITGSSLKDDGSGGSNYYLSPAEIERMIRSGRWEIESHGKEDHYLYAIDAAGTEGHFISNKLWLPHEGRLETESEFSGRVSSDLIEAKEALEKAFGREVIAYAYPFGDYGWDGENFPAAERVVDSIVPSIYKLAFYQTNKDTGDWFNYPARFRYMAKRIEPPDSWSGEDLIAVLSGGHAKELPYENWFFGSDWVGTWGSVEPGGSALTLQGSGGTTGASAFLNGTGGWTDYAFSASVRRERGEAVMLAARYLDAKNYLLCAFGNSRVSAKEIRNGVATTLGSTEAAVFSGRSAELSIAIRGNSLSCGAGGSTLLRVAAPQTVNVGSIGIQVWDEVPDTARAVITGIAVHAL